MIDVTEIPRMRRREEDDRPPEFEARRGLLGKHDKQRMLEWVCSRLDDIWEMTELRGSKLDDAYEEFLEVAFDAEGSEHLAVLAAEHKDLGPLRRMFPGHARFINLPTLSGPRDRWKTYDSFDVHDPRFRLQIALKELPHIRSVWKEYYGRSNRRESDDLRPENILAERWGLDIDEIRSKRLSRRTLARLAASAKRLPSSLAATSSF
ncbi:hypothetical protein ACFKHW_37730 [Bradyrhizobium lupini]|uniref:hypothetical protein n=1 Tax=Rhizobium lupini TaxID=136996 RepID=UPI00366F9A1E